MGLFDEESSGTGWGYGDNPHDRPIRGQRQYTYSSGDGCAWAIVAGGIGALLGTGIAGPRAPEVFHQATQRVIASTQSPASPAGRDQAIAEIARAKALDAKVAGDDVSTDSDFGLA